MTKEHAEFIASRVPGAVTDFSHRHQFLVRVQHVPSHWLWVESDGRIYREAPTLGYVTSDDSIEFHNLILSLESALAASVAAGFPDLREGKDASQ